MIKPKCLDKWGFFGWSATGYLLPCCWMDHENMNLIPELVQEKFKVENVDKISDIIKSDEWQSFFNTIKNDQDNAPHVCHHYCGSCTEST